MPPTRIALILLIPLVGCASSREHAAAPSPGRAPTRSEKPIVRVVESSPERVSGEAEDHPVARGIRTVVFDRSADQSSDATVQPAESAQPHLEPTSDEPTRPVDPRREHPIDLSTTLALVAGQNPQVQFARWRINEAYAQLDTAKVLWLPSIQAGVSYHRHDGTYQASNGAIVDVNRSSLNAGFGAGAVGAGTVPNPGLVARFQTTDAIFAPRIAERTAWARGHAAKAELNDQLLAAALAYLEMMNAAQQRAIAEETLANTADLTGLTIDFAETGQGLQADADRMAAELAVRKNDVIRAEEATAVAGIRLAEVVSFDTTGRLVPVEANVVPIEFVSAGMDPQALIVQGLSNRPELHAARWLVAEACERYQREKYAPLLPSVLLGVSYSGFGGGLGDQVGSFHDRADFDALAMWEVRNLGFGERAARETASTRVEQRRWEQVRVMDRIASEIAEAAAQVDSRRSQIEVSEEAIANARLSHERNLSRIRQNQGLPIEVLQSIQALDVAQREYLRAVISYNEAQFRLHRALGWPIRG